MKLLPRCVGTTRDNTQCGRRVSDGSNPPLCHIHLAISRGQAVNPQTDPVFDPMKDLHQLTRSSDDRVKLRAIDLILELKRKDEEKQARRVSAGGPSAKDVLDAMTDDEREEIRLLSARFREIQRAVFTRRPDLTPSGWNHRAPQPDPVVSAQEPEAAYEDPSPEEAVAPTVVEDDDLEEGDLVL